ncbi:MAG: hypothetical protein ABSH03_03360 [Candidatus Lustribacter sp.]|jgi:hypothetical protein
MQLNARSTRTILGAAVGVAVFAGAFLHAPASGATQRFATGLTPLLDAANGKTIGTVGPGAALNVIGESGAATHVTVTGFAAQSTPATVYAYADRHIIVLGGFSGKAVNGATQSVGGTAYVAVTIDGWVASNALAPDAATVWKAASALYQQKCSTCHSLRPPTDYTANQWPALMKVQADNAGLDPGETALITAYLQTQSGK